MCEGPLPCGRPSRPSIARPQLVPKTGAAGPARSPRRRLTGRRCPRRTDIRRLWMLTDRPTAAP
eukprot:16438574-Heterocapsa_arctica.AAC.1